MNFVNYSKLAQRTYQDLGTQLLNSQHMTDGMLTEIGELFECLKLHGSPIDVVNLSEETGDLLWYCGNFSILNKYDMSSFQFLNDGLYFMEKYQRGLNLQPYDLILIYAAQLQNLDKRELAYKKERDVKTQQEIFLNLMKSISDFCFLFRVDPIKSMENNINKLMIRYPNSFNTQDAVERDLVAERKELEK